MWNIAHERFVYSNCVRHVTEPRCPSRCIDCIGLSSAERNTCHISVTGRRAAVSFRLWGESPISLGRCVGLGKSPRRQAAPPRPEQRLQRGGVVMADHVFDGLLKRADLAEQLGKCERTIIRYERAGMPAIAVGMMRLYDPTKVRSWIMSHERRHNVPVRGRPSTRTTA